MPIKECVSKQTMICTVLPAAKTAAVTGAIIDTADYDNGVWFALICSVYSSGAWALVIQEGDAADMSDASTVSGNNLINALPTVAAVQAVTAIGTETGVPKVGVISTKRYLRANISLAATGSATLGVYAIVNPEIAKTAASI